MSLHCPHSSHCSIISVLLTCWTLGSKGRLPKSAHQHRLECPLIFPHRFREWNALSTFQAQFLKQPPTQQIHTETWYSFNILSVSTSWKSCNNVSCSFSVPRMVQRKSQLLIIPTYPRSASSARHKAKRQRVPNDCQQPSALPKAMPTPRSGVRTDSTTRY